MWLPMCVFDGNGFTMVCLAIGLADPALKDGCMGASRSGWNLHLSAQSTAQRSDYQPGGPIPPPIGGFSWVQPDHIRPIDRQSLMIHCSPASLRLARCHRQVVA